MTPHNTSTSAIALSQNVRPFDVLFCAALQEADTHTLDAKVQFLTNLTDGIERLEDKAENEANLFNWLSIFAGIGSTAVIISAATLNPIAALLSVTVSVGSSITTIGGSIFKRTKEVLVMDELKRYRLALERKSKGESAFPLWAILWDLVGVEGFLDSLSVGSKGVLQGEKLIKKGGELPLTAAINRLADRFGMEGEQLAQAVKGIKVGRNVDPAILSKLRSSNTFSTGIKDRNRTSETTPAIPMLSGLSETDNQPNFYQNALALRDSLVNKAEDQSLPGCVILAAPGAGKTTFLGSVWLKLRESLEEDLSTLAVVVKRADVESFKKIASNVICSKTSSKRAAIEIIKFINEGMTHDGKVKRLFLDDYLTSQKYLAAATKKTYIDLETYAIFESQKEAKEQGSFDAILLSDALETSLNEAWLVGREYNLCLWVSSHSSNVEDLPFVGSSDARSVGDFILLARDDKRDFINNALNNNYLLSDSPKRAQLKGMLDGLSVTTGEPLLLSNFNNWTLGIVSKSIREEYDNLLHSAQQTTIQSTQKTVIQSNGNDTVLQGEDAVSSDDSLELHKDLEARRLGISIEAYKVLNKLREFESKTTIRELCRKRPLGRDSSTAEAINYYLVDLINAGLAIKDMESDKEMYQAVTLSPEE